LATIPFEGFLLGAEPADSVPLYGEITNVRWLNCGCTIPKHGPGRLI
jgi:hypothetical protein